MADNLKEILKKIEERTSKGKNVCTAKLVKYCIDVGIDIPRLYMELHKNGKMKYLK
jgi:hypothetical protein